MEPTQPETGAHELRRASDPSELIPIHDALVRELTNQETERPADDEDPLVGDPTCE